MTNWKEFKLGETLLSANTGLDAIKRAPIVSQNTGKRCLRIQDISQSKKYEDWGFTDVSDSNFMKFKLLKNDIIIARTGATVGVNMIIAENINSVFNNGLIRIRAKEKFCSKFLYYHLRSNKFWEHINGIAFGTTSQPNIQINQLLEYKITAPDLTTQTAIAEILSSLDDKIELNNKINQELEALAQTLFKQWFIDFDFPNENGEPYKTSGGEMVDSELGEIPKGWTVTSFKENIEVNRGLSYKGSGLANSLDGIPMVNLNSVYEGGGYKYEGIKYYSGEYKERHIINPWELAITNTEQGHKYLLIGYPAFVPKNIGNKVIFSHHIYRINPIKLSYLSSQFLYYLIKFPKIREQIIGACNGTTVNMLKIQGLETPKFVKPNKETIISFSNIISEIWNTFENNYSENQSLTNLLDTLLPKLISGDIEVGNL